MSCGSPKADGSLKVQSGAAEFMASAGSAGVARPETWSVRSQGRQQIVAPMPGKIVRILVQTGEAVEAGQGLVVMEAMKMQNEIRSPKSGKVERI